MDTTLQRVRVILRPGFLVQSTQFVPAPLFVIVLFHSRILEFVASCSDAPAPPPMEVFIANKHKIVPSHLIGG